MKGIEFSGIPGSGKSTILPVVAEYLRNQGCDVVDQHNLIQRSKRFPFNARWFRGLMAMFPARMRRVFTRVLNNYYYLNYEYQLKYIAEDVSLLRYLKSFVQVRPIPEAHKNMLFRWFIKMAGSYRMARDVLEEDSVYLLDEGFVQKVISMYVSVEEDAPNTAELERYLDEIPDDLTVINITADQDTCKRRILERRLPKRLEGRQDHEVEAYLSKSKMTIDFAAGYLSKKGSKIVDVDNSSEPFTEARITEQLSRVLNFA